MASRRNITIGRFTSDLALCGFISMGGGTDVVSIKANTNFPNIILGVTEPSVGLALLSDLGGELAFLSAILRGAKLGTRLIRDETRRNNGGGLCHRGFSITISETITELGILYRCYLPCIGINNLFMTVGKPGTSRRLSKTRGTLGLLNNGIRGIRGFGLPYSRNRHAVVMVGGMGPAPGRCPEVSNGVGSRPL